MLLISIVLSIGLATQFANSVLSPINEGKLRFIPQQELSVTQEVQDDSPSMSRLSMEGNQQIYPMLQQPIIQQPMMQQPMMQQPMMQQPIMQQPMMQGFNTPFSLNPINQQQLSLLLMSSYARIMALTQLMNMQDKSQLYQSNHYSDPNLINQREYVC
ncbi:PREDICTED: actin cytoskeleton-regulatory complex protein PAN1-like [Diuraphis noxia]|uniref:actin cytoskeleton-regulatory complex protein PAN1-like n=1 Tax=Diuraphis noxia TaxID=143948 RepID=UPI00076369DC|nr:PREDICTED: actin cytoskeleton-regulatory complex protein PAN1-like [Diuraphis noxia]